MADVRSFLGPGEDGFQLPISREQLEAFCKRWRIVELALFGSVLRDDFGPDSDVDVLVTVADDAHWGWMAFDIQEELGGLLGRSVDLVYRKAIEQSDNWILRRQILSTARVIFPAR